MSLLNSDHQYAYDKFCHSLPPLWTSLPLLAPLTPSREFCQGISVRMLARETQMHENFVRDVLKRNDYDMLKALAEIFWQEDERKSSASGTEEEDFDCTELFSLEELEEEINRSHLLDTPSPTPSNQSVFDDLEAQRPPLRELPHTVKIISVP